ncbi:MAG: glycosyltransferase [Clostridiales bacterium]|nr:glycosyltransferase [Clostridiales bacterium]
MNILFLTSYSTGQGHKSITEALCRQIERLAPETNITIVDGFASGNWAARASGQVYNMLAVYFPYLWKLIYPLTDVFPHFINRVTARCIGKELLKRVRETNPDLIVSVHAAFVGASILLLRKRKLSIPVVSVVADLDNVAALWADRDAYAVVCPTEEAKNKMLAVGMPEDKLPVLGFPIRESFTKKDAANPHGDTENLTALLISGSQGSRRIQKIVRVLLDNHTCRMRIITGKNFILKKALELRYASRLGHEIEIMGFIKEIDQYMCQADFLIARASPNVVMEAVALNKPVVITDFFYGQEKKNPAFIENHHLGVVCTDIQRLPSVIAGLSADDGAGWRAIQKSQAMYDKTDAAARAAAFFLKIGETQKDHES